MKRNCILNILRFTVIMIALTVISCQQEDGITTQTSDNTSSIDTRSNSNAAVYPPSANPFGKSIPEWTAAWWQHVFASNLETFPILDETGAFTDLNQTGPVYFLFGTFGTTVERTVTIPNGKAVLFPILNYANTYPCPDPNFEPAPGQSLEDFLSDGASGIMDMGTDLAVLLDGQELNNEEAYRFNSGLFDFTGNSELAALDPCINGIVQQAVSDGYWMMLKKLSLGEHTLEFTGSIPEWGFTVDVTYHITVE